MNTELLLKFSFKILQVYTVEINECDAACMHVIHVC